MLSYTFVITEMKKIFININNDVDEKVIFDRFKQICIEEFQEFKLQIGEHIHLQEKLKDDPLKQKEQKTGTQQSL